MKDKELEGKTIGRLTVLKFLQKIKKVYDNGKSYNKYYYLCKCSCGNEKIIERNNLLNNHTQSCGCLLKENKIKAKTKHGLSKTRLNNIYNLMKNRCFCKTSDKYKWYQGKGITMCEEWKNDFMKFYNWAINNGYKDNLTIDRIDVNGNYCPENCRWVSQQKQMQNTTKNIIYNGKCLSEWARECKTLSYMQFYKRVKKFGLETVVKQYVYRNQ